MKLKNKLKITKGDKVYESFNNLLFPAIEFLSENKAYFSFLALGDNGDETSTTQEYLGGYTKTYPLVTSKFNIDPSLGSLYITKELVLDKTDLTPLEIREVGVTADGENFNPKVANRFLANMGEAIFRDAGEEISFEVTIFLEPDSTSQAVFTAGDNKLVKYLLGDFPNDFNGHPPFLIARGYNTTPNSEIISRPQTGVMLTLASVEKFLDKDNGCYEMKIYADIGAGEVKEFLLGLDDQMVLRSNTSELFGEETGIELTLIADDDNMASINVSGLKSIDEVKDMTTGEILTDYTTRVYGNSFMDGFRRLFQNKSYTMDTWRVVSVDGKMIGFVHDNTMDIYDFSTSTPTLMPTKTTIDTTNAYLITMIRNELLIKYFDSETSTYGVRFYSYHDGKWEKHAFRPTTAAFYKCNAEHKWFDMTPVYAGPSYPDEIVYVTLGETCFIGWKTYLYFNELQSNRVYFNNVFSTQKVFGMQPTNRNEKGMFYMYNSLKDNIGVTNGINEYSFIDNAFATNILKNLNGMASRNYLFGVDESDMSIKAFSVETSECKTISFEGALKIYVSPRLDYVIVKDSDFDYRVFYLDGSLNLYEFNGGLPKLQFKPIDFEFVDNKIITFLENGLIISREVNGNKTAIVGVEMGHEIKVTYSADKTPGAGGGGVRAIVKITTTV